MNNTKQQERTSAEDRPFANYPDNSLGKQYRDIKDVPSVLEVVFNHFKKHNQ